MKKTAVEWLEENMDNLLMEGYKFNSKEADYLYLQAKEMEKQQIESAYKDSTSQFSNDARIDYPKSAEQYYNEKFKKK